MRVDRRAMIAESKVYLALVREIFKASHGRTWSEKWVPIGFTKSLQIPALFGDIQGLMHSVSVFLAKNTALERKDSNVTASYAKALFDALSKAQNDINLQRTTTGTLLDKRNATASQLRKRIRGLINELKLVMEPTDNRWLTFGFNKPGAKQAPAAPTELSATVIGPQAITVKWKPAARAEYYRLKAQIDGIDDGPVLVGSSPNPNFTMHDVLPNSKVMFGVTAVNSGGESPLSELITIVTPAKDAVVFAMPGS